MGYTVKSCCVVMPLLQKSVLEHRHCLMPLDNAFLYSVSRTSVDMFVGYMDMTA